jgi:hypothetical protein
MIGRVPQYHSLSRLPELASRVAIAIDIPGLVRGRTLYHKLVSWGPNFADVRGLERNHRPPNTGKADTLGGGCFPPEAGTHTINTTFIVFLGIRDG